jgi:hypothetical protein
MLAEGKRKDRTHWLFLMSIGLASNMVSKTPVASSLFTLLMFGPLLLHSQDGLGRWSRVLDGRSRITSRKAPERAPEKVKATARLAYGAGPA